MKNLRCRLWDAINQRMEYTSFQLWFDGHGDLKDTPPIHSTHDPMLYIMQGRNDKPIYEDDIVRLPGTSRQGIVTWNTSKPEFYVYGPHGVDWDLHADWEMIGNRWQNPELLTRMEGQS